jgi:mannose-6-phosphate isomerase-like protein (cupin superfamily)
MLTGTHYTVLDRDALPRAGHTYEFEGFRHEGTSVSFIWVDMPPGRGVRLHKHPYQEIFIVEEGSASYAVGGATLEAHAGQIILIPADTPHKFVNTGDGPLRQVDIHVSRQFITDWLEE